MKLKDSDQMPGRLPAKPVEGATSPVKKQPYRKPVLKRLGLLKSVAGSGIVW